MLQESNLLGLDMIIEYYGSSILFEAICGINITGCGFIMYAVCVMHMAKDVAPRPHPCADGLRQVRTSHMNLIFIEDTIRR